MHFLGEIKRDGKFWMVEVPELNLATQGINKQDALFMIADAIEIALNHKGFKASAILTNRSTFVVTANNVAHLQTLATKRHRETPKNH